LNPDGYGNLRAHRLLRGEQLHSDGSCRDEPHETRQPAHGLRLREGEAVPRQPHRVNGEGRQIMVDSQWNRTEAEDQDQRRQRDPKPERGIRLAGREALRVGEAGKVEDLRTVEGRVALKYWSWWKYASDERAVEFRRRLDGMHDAEPRRCRSELLLNQRLISIATKA